MTQAIVAVVAVSALLVAGLCFHTIRSQSSATAPALAPGKVALTASQAQRFSALQFDKQENGVRWGLNPEVGSISSSGVYTAPSSIDAVQTVMVTADSTSHREKSAWASVLLTRPIPSTYFGLTVLDFSHHSPSIPFRELRSWDAGPGLDWADANPAQGVYNFATLDQFLAFSQAHSADAIYTFGRTPRWASMQPSNPASPYGPGQCAPPSNISYWDAYVAAVVTHAAGRIKYWELWNEPNESSYCGDISMMVLMAQHAYQIIKKIDPSALVLSPSPDKASGPAWLASFLAAGGVGSVDVIAFHGYWSDKAEEILAVVDGLHAAAAENGAGNLPIWDTEASWAYTSKMPLPPAAEQAGYLAKQYLLHWSKGVTRFYWYAYDGNPPWGTLFNRDSGETAAARAYRETYRWMVGATLTSACAEVERIWTCGLSRPGGYSAQAVWIAHGSATYAVPKQYTQYVDLAGATHKVTNGGVTIGDQPILLQTGPLRDGAPGGDL